eukprot:1159208-Pelagomonas_calceolata.AAC.11
MGGASRRYTVPEGWKGDLWPIPSSLLGHLEHINAAGLQQSEHYACVFTAPQAKEAALDSCDSQLQQLRQQIEAKEALVYDHAQQIQSLQAALQQAQEGPPLAVLSTPAAAAAAEVGVVQRGPSSRSVGDSLSWDERDGEGAEGGVRSGVGECKGGASGDSSRRGKGVGQPAGPDAANGGTQGVYVHGLGAVVAEVLGDVRQKRMQLAGHNVHRD